MQLLDGKATSNAIKEEIATLVAERVAAGQKRPHLAAVLVGDDGASQTYVASKVKESAAVEGREQTPQLQGDGQRVLVRW